MARFKRGIVVIPGPCPVSGGGGDTPAAGDEDMNPEEWIEGVPTSRIVGLQGGMNVNDCNGSPDDIILSPIQVQNSADVTEMMIRVQQAAAAGGLARMAIYSQAAPGADLSLVFEGADFSTETTGIKTQAVTQTFEPGTLYWVGMKTNAVNFRWYMPNARYCHQGLGGRDDFSNDIYSALLWLGTTFADPFPASLALSAASMNFNVGVAVRFILA